MLAMLCALNKPLCVATMNVEWWEAAAEVGIQRYRFDDITSLLLFVRPHTLLCLHARQMPGRGVDTLVASMDAMGATMFPLAPEA